MTKVAQGRYAAIDLVRGFAILLMIIYHFSWDLTFFGLADFQIFTDLAWVWFANIIVIMILWTMGVSQVLARRRQFDLAVFAKRFLLIAASAGAVSLATWFADPATWVFFGILHHIAVASVISAGATMLPSMVLLALALFALAAPHFLTGPVFDPSWLHWLGLSFRPGLSVDFVPLAPWLAIPLIGIVSGRWLLEGHRGQGVRDWQPRFPGLTAVLFAGRHSLAIYLIHQPVLYGGLYLIMSSG